MGEGTGGSEAGAAHDDEHGILGLDDRLGSMTPERTPTSCSWMATLSYATRVTAVLIRGRDVLQRSGS
jgi:hypothetical protein